MWDQIPVISHSNPKEYHGVTIYFGGTMEKPDIECNCPAFLFRQDCRHIHEVWDSLKPIQKRIVVEHDRMMEKLGAK